MLRAFRPDSPGILFEELDLSRSLNSDFLDIANTPNGARGAFAF